MSTLVDNDSKTGRSPEGDRTLSPINGNSSAAEIAEKQAHLQKSIEHVNEINRIRDLSVLNRASSLSSLPPSRAEAAKRRLMEKAAERRLSAGYGKENRAFQLNNEWRMVSVLGTVYSSLWAIVWAWWPSHHRIRYCHLSSFSECREVPRKMVRDRQEILSVISPSIIQQ